MNLKTKIFITLSLAACIQAQELSNSAVTDSSTTPVTEASISTVADSSALPVSTETATQASIETATAESTLDTAAVAAEPAPAEKPNAAQDSAALVAKSTFIPDEPAQVTEKADSTAAQAVTSDTVAVTDTTLTASATDTTPTASATAQAPTKHTLDILHGNAYNQVGNEAAASTINGDMVMPHKMRGHKLAYVEPANGFGIVSFGETNTYYFAFDNSKKLGLVTAGFAFDKIGFSLSAAIGKDWGYSENNKNDTETTYISTTTGTKIQGAFSTRIGSFDLGISAVYAYPTTNHYSDINDEQIDINAWDAYGKFTIANSNNSKFAWSANLSFLRHQADSTITQQSVFVGTDGKTYLSTHKAVVTDSSSRIEVVPEFNFGSNVLKSEKARVYIGLNTTIPLVTFDRIKGIVSRHNEYGVKMVPNIFGEVSFGKYVMAYGGASYQWDAIQLKDSYVNDIEHTDVKTESGSTTASVGMRVHCDYAALEMTFTKLFVQNPFSSFSDTDAIGVSIGAFVNF